MDSADQIIARVSDILRDAGFTPMPEGPLAGVYCAPNGQGGFVFGGVHEASGEVHAWDPGLSARTTNDPIEAATKLAAYIAAKAPAGDEEPQPDADAMASPEAREPESVAEANDDGSPHENAATDPAGDDYHGAHVTDAEFGEAAYLDLTPAELPELEAPDLGAEILDAEEEAPSGGAFIFGDNLDQKRTAAIGLVTRIALDRTPPWTQGDSARLTELRNFTLGVAEGRWPDDPANRDELDTLENTLRAINAITAARDEKVAFLVTATHADLDVFDPESDWP